MAILLASIALKALSSAIECSSDSEVSSSLCSDWRNKAGADGALVAVVRAADTKDVAEGPTLKALVVAAQATRARAIDVNFMVICMIYDRKEAFAVHLLETSTEERNRRLFSNLSCIFLAIFGGEHRAGRCGAMIDRPK